MGEAKAEKEAKAAEKAAEKEAKAAEKARKAEEKALAKAKQLAAKGGVKAAEDAKKAELAQLSKYPKLRQKYTEMHTVLSEQISVLLAELKVEKEVTGETPNMDELNLLKEQRKVITEKLVGLTAEPEPQ